MIHFTNYLELFKAHPQRFKVQLAYVARSDEPPLSRKRGGGVPSRPLVREEPLVVELPAAFTQIVGIPLQVLLTSGYGEHLIHCERVATDRHKICLKACPSYICYVGADELQRIEYWCKQVSRDFT